jgi:hypothetical protein
MNQIIRCIGMDWKNKGIEEVYTFPDSWIIREYMIRNIRKIDDDAIYEALSGEFQYKDKKTNIHEISKGKKNVVILVDDLSRFTPANKIAHMIIDMLLLADVNKENIRFIVACGSHKQLSKEEMALKLGDEIARDYHVENHDCMSDNVEDFGLNSYGTPIKINKKVAEADLVIGIGSLKKHSFAYGGGGAKILLPGVSHIDTIRHNHSFQAVAYHRSKDKFGKLRDGMNEAAKIFSDRTDFIVVNVALNRERDITDIFIGDCIDVFVNHADHVLDNYVIEYDSKLFGKKRKADVGIFRMDTLDPLQIGKALPNWFSACRFPIITGCFGEHIYQGNVYGTYEDYLNKHNRMAFAPDISLREAIVNKRVIIHSTRLDAKSAKMWNPNYYVTDQWDETIEILKDIFGSKTRVAFFHDAYFQIINKKVVLGFIKNKALRRFINLLLSGISYIERQKNRLFKNSSASGHAGAN